MPATLATPNPLEVVCLVAGIVKLPTSSRRWLVLIGQIKLTRIHVLSLCLPGVRVKRNRKASLYNVERSASGYPKVANTSKLCLFAFHTQCTFWEPAITSSTKSKKKWWSLTGSNRRHPACKAGALPAELRPHSF